MALQHLRSSTAHKRPIPTVMSAGQLAINTNDLSPALFFKDSNGDLVKVGPVHVGSDAPNSSPASVAATALVTGTVYQILTVGTSDFTLVGASANTVGTIFTATGTTAGDGTVSGQQGVQKGEMWLDTAGGAYAFKVYDGTAWRSQSAEFVNVTGDTMTGDLVFNNADIVFEGATADDFETTLTVADPTADRTITLPDTTGTVVTTGDVGTVTNTMLASGIAAATATDATNADNVQVDSDNASNATRYVTFANAGGGADQRIKVDASLTYNPSTNTLSASTFSGDLSGNATTATSATSATNATNATNADTVDSLHAASFLRSDANDTATGIITFTDTPVIAKTNPNLKLEDTDGVDFWIHNNTNDFYVLVDRDGNGSWETPHPMQLESDTNSAYIFNRRIIDNGNFSVNSTGAFAGTVSTHDLNFQNYALISSNGGETNIDHIWHEEANNIWHFCSDTTYKATGNATLQGSGFQVTNGGKIQDATGNYGSVKVTGGSTGGWKGYAIEAGAVFMQKDDGTVFGLYDDTNNHWALQHTKNGATHIYYDGGIKINTVSNGAEIQGSLTVDANIVPDANNTGSVGTSSLTFSTGYFQKVITPEIERTGTITLDANGASADISLSAADHIFLQAGAEEDGAIYFRGNSAADTYRFAKSGQTDIEGFLSFESLTQDRTFTFPNAGGTIALTSSTVATATNCSRSITGGNGLTGGGALTANRTLNVGAGSGISVSADAVAVDSTVIRTTGDQTMSGTKTFSGAITATGVINVRSALDFADADVLRMGSSDDWTVTYNENGWNYINQKQNGIIFQDNGTNVMRLEDSGVFRPETTNTGTIGTSSAYWDNGYFQDFNVSGTINVRGAIDLADNDILRLGSGDDAELFCNGSHLYLDLNAGIGNFYIRDGTTTRYTFDDNGKLTATRFASATTSASDVAYQRGGDSNTGYGFSGTYDFAIYGQGTPVIQGGTTNLLLGAGSSTALNPGTTGTNKGMYIASQGQVITKRDSSNNASSALLTGGETGRLEIRSDGDCVNTNGRYQQLSDERIKENIVDAKSQWEDIKALRWVNYNYKPATNLPQTTMLGVVAQEAELVSPGLVDDGLVEETQWDDSIKQLFVTDEEGKEYEEYKCVAYSLISMKAAKALQEALYRIEELEARLAQLENNG